jgi:hypothetical protein
MEEWPQMNAQIKPLPYILFIEIELTQLHNHLMKSNPLLLPGGTVYILNLDSNVFRQ